jgi:hypothetical protein
VKRYWNPFLPRDVYAGLAELLALVKQADGLAPAVRLWLTHGIRAALETPGLGLDGGLGLKPGRGKRGFHEVRKRELIRQIGAALHGTHSARATQIAAVIRGEAPAPEVLAETAVGELRRFTSVPRSTRAVLRILTSDTK